MPRNIEIKARAGDAAGLRRLEDRVAGLATEGPTVLQQDDSFFHCRHGRLKLRVFADGRAELIAYDRPDDGGPKTSTYVRTPVADPTSLRDALGAACGLVGRVRKRRTLYRIGRTRVHLDEVDGLGVFVELEVVLADDEAAAGGVAEAHDLMRRLGIGEDALVAGAYLDLLAAGPSAAG
jgi:predicted adenylyl cyclase CyaB